LLADYAGRLQGMWLLYSYARTYLPESLQYLPIDNFLTMKIDVALFLGTDTHSPTGNWSFHKFNGRRKILKSMKLKSFWWKLRP